MTNGISLIHSFDLFVQSFHGAFNPPKNNPLFKNHPHPSKTHTHFLSKLHLRAHTAINRIQNVIAASGQSPLNAKQESSPPSLLSNSLKDQLV